MALCLRMSLHNWIQCGSKKSSLARKGRKKRIYKARVWNWGKGLRGRKKARLKSTHFCCVSYSLPPADLPDHILWIFYGIIVRDSFTRFLYIFYHYSSPPTGPLKIRTFSSSREVIRNSCWWLVSSVNLWNVRLLKVQPRKVWGRKVQPRKVRDTQGPGY